MRHIAGIVIVASLTALAGAAGASSGGGSHPSALATLMSLLFGDPLTPVAQGQPSVDCADFPSRPGHSATAPGSAFNPSGKSGTVYAGEQPQNSKNPASVSQYDVACSKQPAK